MTGIEEPRSSEVPEQLRQQAGWIMGLDKLVHEPSRLAILTILRHLGRAEYLSLKEWVSLSKGNLSNHLVKLEESGLVSVEKHFEQKKPVTMVILTSKGMKVMEAYFQGMRRIADAD